MENTFRVDGRGLLSAVTLFGVLALGLAGCKTTAGIGQIERGDYDSAFAHIEEFIVEQMKSSGTVGLSVVVTSDSEILWSAGFGYADAENGVEATAATLYDVASVSKVFTATAVMQLVERGLVDLDAPITDYIPEFSMHSRFSDAPVITVRNLMTHHAGIPPDWLKGFLYRYPEAFEAERTTYSDLPEILHEANVCWPPEYTWGYSNLGYSLLAIVVERVTGTPFTEYANTELFAPLGMEASSFDPRTYTRAAVGYADRDPIPLLVERETPAGALVTSVEEIAGFMISYLNETDDRLLDPETREAMYRRQNGHVARDLDFQQGLGWVIADFGFQDLGRIVFHDGGEWSANTNLALMLDEKIGIAVFTNSAEGAGITVPITQEIIRAVYRARTGEDPTEYSSIPRAVVNPDVESLRRYEGTYLYQTLGPVAVEVRRGGLWLTSGGLGMKMIALDNGRYRLKPMLFGFLPIRIAFLEPMEISFEEVEGEMLSGVYDNGMALPEIGIRIERPTLSQLWFDRQGTYDVVNAAEGEFLIIDPWEFTIEDGLPTVRGELYGSYPFSLVLMPQDDEVALWAGIGRRSGDTFRFEERDGTTFIHYQGLIYRKRS